MASRINLSSDPVSVQSAAELASFSRRAAVESEKSEAGQLKLMYRWERLFQEEEEFCFEELRANSYYTTLSEKVSMLSEMKQNLHLKILQKTSVCVQKSSADAPQEASAQVSSLERRCAVEDLSLSAFRNGSAEENVFCDQEAKPKSETVAFTVFDENLPVQKPSVRTPGLSVSVREEKRRAGPLMERPSVSRMEDAIVNTHVNKTLCTSPNDTSDFARAASLASTPFDGGEKPGAREVGLMESFSTSRPEAVHEESKLSPILEVSLECGVQSVLAITQIPLQPCETLVEEPLPDVCVSEDRCRRVRSSDVSSHTHQHQERLPEACGSHDFCLDGEMLLYVGKCGTLETHTLYFSSTGPVIMKVDSCVVPWDFFISSRLQDARSHTDAASLQISCHVYEDGCVTLWRFPRGSRLEELLQEPVSETRAALLVLQLLEMLKKLHACHVIHAHLRTHTLLLHDSVLTPLDYSHSLDLQPPSIISSAGDVPSSAHYIQRGLLMPTASPNQVDLLEAAELVHTLLFQRPMEVTGDASGWGVCEENTRSSVHPVWREFFRLILNPGLDSSELILSKLTDVVMSHFSVAA